MRSPSHWALLGTLAVLATAPAAGAAKPAPRPFVALPGAGTEIASGGDRYFAYVRGSGSRGLYVVDTKRRATRYQSLPQGCGLTASFTTPRDRILLWCESGSAIMALSDGHLVGERLRPTSSPASQWTVMGTVWLGRGNLYRNVDTGEVRQTDDPAVAASYRNLNDPGLGVRVFCAPFTHEYQERAEQQWGGHALLAPRGSGSELTSVQVGTCADRSSPKTLSRDAISDGSLDFGYTAWATPPRPRSTCSRQVSAYDVIRKRTVRWAPSRKCVDRIRHTRYAVILAKSVGSDPDDDTSDPPTLYHFTIAPRP